MIQIVDSPILHIKDYGQSLWMDNLSRDSDCRGFQVHGGNPGPTIP